MMDFDLNNPLQKRGRDGAWGDREEIKRHKASELGAQTANEIGVPPPSGGAQPIPLAAPALPNVAAGGRKDNSGTVHLYFMAMGQGDCTFIISPNNKIFIVDMGTDGSQKYDKTPTREYFDSYTKLDELIKQNNIFGVDKVAEALIITHSDGDHHNQLTQLHSYGVSAKRIYYSNIFDSYMKVSKGVETKTSSKKLMSELLREQVDYQLSGVSYTTGEETPADPPQTYSDAAKSPAPVKEYRALSNQKGRNQGVKEIPDTVMQEENKPFEPYYEKDKGIVIYDEPEKCFSIRILVGNYRNCDNAAALAEPSANTTARLEETYGVKTQKFYTARNALWQKNYERLRDNNITEQRTLANDVNRASIVVHIRYQPDPADVDSTEDYIICGDATGETLDMIRTQYRNLENVTILQAPHHGSASYGSPNQDFFKKMKPQIAVYSCPYGKIATHKHPRLVSVQRMQQSMQSNGAMRSNYGAWYSGIYYESVNMPYRIYMTGWMRNGYYHYIAPLNTPTNHPKLKSEIAAGEDIDKVVNVFRNPIPVDADPKNDKTIPDKIVLYDDLNRDSTGDIPDVYDAVLDELGNVLSGGGVISSGGSVDSGGGTSSGSGDMSDDEDPVSDGDDEDPVSDGDDGGDDGDDSDFEG